MAELAESASDVCNTALRYGLSDGETVSEEYVKQCEVMCNLGFLHLRRTQINLGCRAGAEMIRLCHQTTMKQFL